MSTALRIVHALLHEAGEADQDYDHELMDKIVNDLEAAGFPGATHREFDKYQGVYLRVPGIGKFWLTYDTQPSLVPEHDPKNFDDHVVTEIPVEFGGEVDSSALIGWINDRFHVQLIHKKAQADAEDFMDQTI